MVIYKNHTRFPAIVTVKIESTSDPQKALGVGDETLSKNVAADQGCHDLLVDPGKEIQTLKDTNASVLCVRSAG